MDLFFYLEVLIGNLFQKERRLIDHWFYGIEWDVVIYALLVKVTGAMH